MSDRNQVGDNDGHNVNLGRHQAQCTICNSPHREEIEQNWIDWVHPVRIAEVYGVSRDAQYRHAHALGLFGKRSKNVARALEQIIEKAAYAPPSASSVVSAIKAYVKLNSAGQGTEQAQSINLRGLFERMSQEERAAFARDGSLPDWFPPTMRPTPRDGQGDGKGSEAPEPQVLQ
jgi:hypothetical protein